MAIFKIKYKETLIKEIDIVAKTKMEAFDIARSGKRENEAEIAEYHYSDYEIIGED